jgi:uroporphyrin-III C-methyltransferase/precorrin-2 dehydrogenase/sirohydrochlorin ferrochelatase
VQFVTGQGRRGGLPPNLDFPALADPHATTCVYMGKATAMQFARRLIVEGLPPDTPAVAMSNVSRPDERVETMSVGDLASGEGLAAAVAPVIVMIGRVFGRAAAMDHEAHESSDAPRWNVAPVA